MGNYENDLEKLVPEWVRERVLSLESPDDWDGRGSSAISKNACEAAVHLIAKVRRDKPEMPLPVHSPYYQGAVQLYWSDNQRNAAVRVFSGDRMTVQYRKPNERYLRNLESVDEDTATSFLYEFFAASIAR